jgi:tetratricopeptide (TPR) repeat protein
MQAEDYKLQHDYVRAKELYLQMANQSKDDFDLTQNLLEVVLCCMNLGECAEAEIHISRLESIYRTTKQYSSLINLIDKLIPFFEKDRNYPKIILLLQKECDACELNHSPTKKCSVMEKMANVYIQLNDLRKAGELYEIITQYDLSVPLLKWNAIANVSKVILCYLILKEISKAIQLMDQYRSILTTEQEIRLIEYFMSNDKQGIRQYVAEIKRNLTVFDIRQVLYQKLLDSL